MRILVVDSNRSFATKIKEVLERQLKEAHVDTADNLFILRDRVKKTDYDFIIADVLSALNPDELLTELEHINVPKIVWTVVPSLTELHDRVSGTVLSMVRKPCSCEDAMHVLAPMFSGSELPAVK